MKNTLQRTTLAVMLGLLTVTLADRADAKKTRGKKAGRGKAANAIPHHPNDIHYPPLAEINLPEPTRFTLDNGMQILLLEDHELPLIQGRAIIRTGGRYEPADKVGLAQLTGSVMRSGGTERMASDALDTALENMAAVVETGISGTSGIASMNSLAEDLDRVLPLFADVLRRPAFEEDKIEVAKTGAKANIARQNDSPGQILGREFAQVLYGDASPYARDVTYESIDAIGRDDLVAWHATYFHPENLILGMTGDFDAAEMRRKLEAIFGDWPRGNRPIPPLPEVDTTIEPGVYFIEKSDVNQANIAIGHFGIDRRNPDYFTVEVLNEVFGGGFSSRLMSEVRSTKGLAYSVGGSVGSTFDHPGLFQMQMSTKTETTGEGVDALLIEARRILSEPPTPEEVTLAKESILSSMVFTADDISDILQRQVGYAYYDYPSDWLSQYQQAVAEVTPAMVAEVAKKYIHPDQVAIMVVGPTKETQPPLSSFGTLREVDITIPEPAVETVAFSEAAAARGKALIAQAVDAAGGEALLDGLTALRVEADNQVVTPQGTFDVGSVSTTAYPARQRLEMILPFGKMTQVLDGDDSWMQTPQGVQPMPPPLRAQIRESFTRAYHNLLRQRSRDDFEAIAAGDDEVDGTKVEEVQVQLDDQTLRLGIDPASGRVLRLIFRGTDNTGTPGEITTVHRDFRTVDGLLVPHESELTFEGAPMMSIKVKAVEVNPTIADDLWAMPE